MQQSKVIKSVIAVGVLMITSGGAVLAATEANSRLTQQINAGVLSTSILDTTGQPVANPSFGMSATTVSNTAVQTSTGALGTNEQRLTVDNPGAANNGWTLALAGAAGAKWTSGANNYSFNATASDQGQLSITSAGTVTPVIGDTTGVSGASTSTFSNTTSSITIMDAASNSADVWNGYITGIGLSQTVPVGTPVGAYTLNLVQTITAK